MPDEIPKQTPDELTPTLRKALVELGFILPTTPEEVGLAEAHLTDGTTPEEVEASFQKLEQMLDDESLAPSFMRLDESVVSPTNCGLSMAARNGVELDEETLARIEESVARATRKPPQN